MAESCVEAESYVASGSDDETTDSTSQSSRGSSRFTSESESSRVASESESVNKKKKTRTNESYNWVFMQKFTNETEASAYLENNKDKWGFAYDSTGLYGYKRYYRCKAVS